VVVNAKHILIFANSGRRADDILMVFYSYYLLEDYTIYTIDVIEGAIDGVVV